MLSPNLVKNPLDHVTENINFKWNETSLFACHCTDYTSTVLNQNIFDVCLSLITGFLSPRMDSPLIRISGHLLCSASAPGLSCPQHRGWGQTDTRTLDHGLASTLPVSLCVSLNPCLSKHTNSTSHAFVKLRSKAQFMVYCVVVVHTGSFKKSCRKKIAIISKHLNASVMPVEIHLLNDLIFLSVPCTFPIICNVTSVWYSYLSPVKKSSKISSKINSQKFLQFNLQILYLSSFWELFEVLVKGVGIFNFIFLRNFLT